MNESVVARATLQKPRLVALLLLAVSGLFVASQGLEADPGPDRLIASCAVGLAAAAIVLRRAAQAPSVRERSATLFGLAALGATVGLGLLGAWTAGHHGAGQTGLLFVLAGVIFAIRPLKRPRAG